MNQQQLVPIFEQWPMDGVVWDGAPSHRGKLMGQLGFGRISLPAYSPELNPAEGVFEEVRRHIEGEVYPSLEVWPESHWPGFALRQADVFQSYTAW